MISAVFLDRDGTLIEDGHYLNDPAGVKLLPGVVDALKKMRAKGYLLYVVSNQSGVSRGRINDEQFLAVHRRLGELLQAEGVDIAEFAYCFHHPDDKCTCRKPQPGLIPKEFGGKAIDWQSSFTVGDKSCDVELAVAIGGNGYLVLTGKGRESWESMQRSSPVAGFKIAPTLSEVADDLPNRA